MTYDQVHKYYGTQAAIAAAVGILQPAVSSWGKVIPPRYQFQFEVMTNGALIADRALLPNGIAA